MGRLLTPLVIIVNIVILFVLNIKTAQYKCFVRGCCSGLLLGGGGGGGGQGVKSKTCL